MKKIILGLLMVFTISSFGQMATKQMQTAQNNTLISIKSELDSINTQNRIYEVVHTFTSSNMGILYSVNRGINSFTAAAGCYSTALPNGIYEVVNIFNTTNNSGIIPLMRLEFFNFNVGQEGDNQLGTVPTMTSNIIYYQGRITLGGGAWNSGNFTIVEPLLTSANYPSKLYVKVNDGYLYWNYVCTTPYTPSSLLRYYTKITLRRLK